MMPGFTRGRMIATAIVAAAVFYLVNRITGAVSALLASGVSGVELFMRFEDIPNMILLNPMSLAVDDTALISGGAAAVVVVLAVIYRISGSQNLRPGEEQGSASWARPGDFPRQMRGETVGHHLKLTRTESLSTDTYKTRRNLNVLVMGASGSGKTRSYILPNLRELEASTAITDPKGEIIRSVRCDLEARGISVRTLNLIDLHNSGKFNPVRYITRTAAETGIAQLTECIISNTSGEKPVDSDSFWERAERALLTALTAFTWATVPQNEDSEPSLPGVLDLQKGIQGSEENPDDMTSETDLKFAVARTIVEEWHNDPHPDDDPIVMKVLDFACRQYRVYEQGPAETRMSIVISLGVRLAPMDMHDLREILAGDDLALDRVGYEPTALFLQISDTHKTFKFIAAMFWQTLFTLTVYQADHEKSGHLPRLLHCFLDEFANIGKIPNFEQLMATIRSRKISCSLVVQSHSQGKNLFGDAWAGIVNNCDTKLFLGGDEAETTKWVSGQLGVQTIITKETSETKGSNGSWSKSNRVTKRELMLPDEVGRMSDDEALLMIRGVKPFRSKKLAA